MTILKKTVSRAIGSASPTRVLHVGPGFGQRGGIASVLGELAGQKALFERGHVLVSFFETHGFKSVLSLLSFLLVDVPRFSLMMIGSKVQIVHFHVSVRGSFYRKLLLYLIARIARKKTIFHLHAGNFESFQSRWGSLTRTAASWFIRSSSAAIAVSGATADELGRHRDIRDNIYVIGNTAFDAELAGDTAVAATAGDKIPPYIAFAGRFTESKGLGDLMRAVALLRKQGLAVQLRMAGMGDVDHWNRIATDYGIDDCILFMGWLDSAAKLSFYRHARFFCMPSHYESFGIATLEAMLLGVPVVGTKLGGFLDLVDDGVTGYLVESGDAEALAGRIRMLVEDPVLAANMGCAARDLARRRYSTEVIVDRYVQCYRAVMVPKGDAI